MSESAGRFRWLVLGDANAFFGLMFDNLTVMSFLAGILVIGFGYPADIVYTRMFPGTALGVLFGDLVYTWMAWRLARRTGRAATAMPLGLDTPSTVGIALVVLGPAFVSLKASGLGERDAALQTWHIGMATMVFIGILKLGLSFAGAWIQRVVPQAGLLGSLAGIGLALIGFLIVDVFSLPLVGAVSLGLVLYNLVAGIRLPRGLPGVLVAVVLGTALYHVLGPSGLLGTTYAPPTPELHFGLPLPTLAFVGGLVPALKYLPIAIPFGLLTVVGGINVTESARVAGDDYDTRDILLTEAVATLLAGVCGGVAQSTPYIGQPAYKGMGARAGYTLLTGLFIGLGGIFGYVSFIVEAIPRAVLAPILVFVALAIVSQAFLACPARHAAAVAFAFLPTVARLVWIKLSDPSIVPVERIQALLSQSGTELPATLVTLALGNGFILTAMLWGAFLAEMIDRRLRACALYLLLLALFSFFGLVHSPLPDGSVSLPWSLGQPLQRTIVQQFTAAYLVLAALVFGLSFSKESREAPSAPHHA
jgi:AGZA family xanthine/uracil permease-like MFS transporter